MINRCILKTITELLLLMAFLNADLAAQDKNDKTSNKPAPPPQELQFKLTLAEANAILDALGNLPYPRVHDLIAKIQNQAREQLQRNPEPPAAPQPKNK